MFFLSAADLQPCLPGNVSFGLTGKMGASSHNHSEVWSYVSDFDRIECMHF